RDLAGRTACGGCHVDVEVLVALEVRLDREPLSVRRELRLQDRLIGAQEGLLSLRPDVQDENGPLLALVRRVREASSVGRHIEAAQLPDFLQEPLGRERDLATHETPSFGEGRWGQKAIPFQVFSGGMLPNVATLPITVGVGAFLVRERGLLVVRKTYGPSKGQWTILSGYVERLESIVYSVELGLKVDMKIIGWSGSILAVRNRLTEAAN